jgi:hypothetical protein
MRPWERSLNIKGKGFALFLFGTEIICLNVLGEGGGVKDRKVKIRSGKTGQDKTKQQQQDKTRQDKIRKKGYIFRRKGS